MEPAPEIPPLPAAEPPPVVPPESKPKPARGQHFFTVLLSLCLGIFLADALVSLLDDSLILFCGLHLLGLIRGLTSLLVVLMTVLIYVLMGLTPLIPKRIFLPITLFTPAAVLVLWLMMIYFYGRIQWVVWGLSLCQVILALGVLCWVQGGFKFRWPLVGENWLGVRRFSWWNLGGFTLANIFVLLPVAIIYCVFCAGLAIDHFSDGFMELRPAGFTVKVRKYIRADGKTIELVPMSHVAESDFYHRISKSFPTNATILLEGVSDNRNLLTNHITYKRMANSLGVAEQQKEFKPRGDLVRADVDIAEFSPETIDFLNLVMFVHAKGASIENVLKLLQFSPPPHFEERLLDDLLRKRNRHLLEEINTHLADSDNLIVPWGVAHMPELAQSIQKSGFHLIETQEYVAIRFHSEGNKGKDAGAGQSKDTPKNTAPD